MRPLPATYSVVSSEALREQVLVDYPIGALHHCRLHMSDLYDVRSERGRYMRKVYSWGLRSRSDVLYELDLLAHLHGKGVGVALPVPRTNGERSHSLPAAEGTRQAVLYHHPPGQTSWP